AGGAAARDLERAAEPGYAGVLGGERSRVELRLSDARAEGGAAGVLWVVSGAGGGGGGSGAAADAVGGAARVIEPPPQLEDPERPPRPWSQPEARSRACTIGS